MKTIRTSFGGRYCSAIIPYVYTTGLNRTITGSIMTTPVTSYPLYSRVSIRTLPRSDHFRSRRSLSGKLKRRIVTGLRYQRKARIHSFYAEDPTTNGASM